MIRLISVFGGSGKPDDIDNCFKEDRACNIATEICRIYLGV